MNKSSLSFILLGLICIIAGVILLYLEVVRGVKL